MNVLHSQNLAEHLKSTFDYHIVGQVDLDQLISQPRNTLYKLFAQWHKPVYEHNERIVLYSRSAVSIDLLTHIQMCGSLIDISNFFILICSPVINDQHLEQVRTQHSTDQCVFSSWQVNFEDTVPVSISTTALRLPDTFCFAPWAHLEIGSQGNFRPCCVFKESIKSDNHVPFNINSDSIDQVYHSKYMTKLRTQFLQGQRPQQCSACWSNEQHGSKSNRQWLTDHLGSSAHQLEIEKNSVDNLISLDIKLGNLCNFKCRICGPGSSSRIADEQVKYFNASIDLLDQNRKSRWVENSKIWNMLQTLGHQLVNIDFYGGEPFLIKQHETFLDFLINHNFAHKIRLHYNSNGSVYPKHLFDKWKLFRQVDIAFSIDNIGQRFEFERGGSWSEVESNLDKFLTHKLPNMVLSIFPTINIQNVYYLNELIDWFETKKFNALVFNMLESPSFLNIGSMNQELNRLVINKLSTLTADKLIKYGVDSIIKRIEQNLDSSNSIDQLADYMLKLDKVRNQRFDQTHKAIANIIYKGIYHG